MTIISIFLATTSLHFFLLNPDLAANTMMQLEDELSSTRHARQQQQQQPNKLAMVTLISNFTSDVRGISNAIEQLHPRDSNIPILIFHQGDVTEEQQEYIRAKNSARHVEFPVQPDFDKFPPIFNPSLETPSFVKRSKWGYQHMCRFWISLVWHHPALEPFDSILRIDADSCSEPSPNKSNSTMLKWKTLNLVYHANPPIVNDVWPNHGLWEFVLHYMQIHNLQPKNPTLFHLAEQSWNESKRLPMFRNNLEVDRLAFFRSSGPVQEFQKYVANNVEFYRNRWGDAPIRFLTMAIFATPDQLDISEIIPGYQHGSDACGTEGIRVWKKIRAK
eukprot:scaffold5341_cov93-Cylindrotheca_fusiformis.AAC.1